MDQQGLPGEILYKYLYYRHKQIAIQVSEHSTPEVTQCTCLALSSTSIFSAEFFVPPNTINFATVFAKINIAENPAVFSTVIAIIGIYLLMLVWARRADINDAKKVSCFSRRETFHYDLCS